MILTLSGYFYQPQDKVCTWLQGGGEDIQTNLIRLTVQYQNMMKYDAVTLSKDEVLLLCHNNNFGEKASTQKCPAALLQEFLQEAQPVEK